MNKEIREIFKWVIHNAILSNTQKDRETIIHKDTSAIKKIIEGMNKGEYSCYC